MSDRPDVTLESVTASDAPVLANLLQLYVHDLSELFAIELGADGRFGYDPLPRYWSEPDTHFPFFIRVAGRLAGFALVTRGSPATDDPAHLDVAEFFVLRLYRRAGIGRQAASLLWSSLPGHWVVRVAEGNHAGLDFWESTIRDYTGGAYSKSELAGTRQVFRVFTFVAALSVPAA